MKILFAILTVITALIATATASRADITLTFGTYAGDKPSETVRELKPFLDYLAYQIQITLGEPVTIVMKIAPTYDQAIDNLINGTVDFSRFGPSSYVLAKTRAPTLRIIATEAQNSQRPYKGVIAVHKDSDIRHIADLRGRSFAFASPFSTIGRYFAQSQLLTAGIDSQGLSHHMFLNRHDRVGVAVAAKTYDAGALETQTFQRLIQDGAPLRSIKDFDQTPKPWIAGETMPESLIPIIRDIMLHVRDKAALSAVAQSGFVIGNDSYYQPVRDAMAQSRGF